MKGGAGVNLAYIRNAHYTQVSNKCPLGLKFYVFIKAKGHGCTNACIYMGTHGQPLLQYRLMDVYETW